MDEIPSFKTLIAVFGLYSSAMIGLVGWIGVNTVETSVAVSGIHTEMTIQIPRILKDIEGLRTISQDNAAEIIKINKANLPYLESVVNGHLRDHERNDPKQPDPRRWDTTHMLNNKDKKEN